MMNHNCLSVWQKCKNISFVALHLIQLFKLFIFNTRRFFDILLLFGLALELSKKVEFLKQ